ncbi:MAG: DUF1653 domain-containing protein [Patescibacteria group bacterium]
MDKIIIGGRYRHFKGDEYRVIAVAKHSETQEEFVVYQSVKDDRVWVRPTAMFLENVEWEGYNGLRFTYLKK